MPLHRIKKRAGLTIRILYDNTKVGPKYQAGWGFAAMLGKDVLFDTGEDYAPLAANADKMGVDLLKIRTVVLSHDHWDHTGGLWGLLKKKPGLDVVCCPGFSRVFKARVKKAGANLIEVSGPRHIGSGLYSTGPMAGLHKRKTLAEQSLVWKKPGRLLLLTGCAHPGVRKIAGYVQKLYKPRRITHYLGGFHLMDKKPAAIKRLVANLRFLGVRRIGPAHCSGGLAQTLFKKYLGRDYIALAAGRRISI